MWLYDKGFKLAQCLFEQPNRVMSRKRLMQKIWGRDDETLSPPDEMHSATWRLEIPNVELSPIYKILQPLTEGPSLGINEISANIDKKTKFSTKLCLTKIWYTSV